MRTARIWRRSKPSWKPRASPPKRSLAFGNPANEIIKWVEQKHCDLIAMSTHGHRLLGDLFFGVTAHKVQHQVTVPVLMLKVKN